jgi:hypothetical protein
VAATVPMRLEVERPRREVALELVDDHFPLLLVRWVGNIQPQHMLRMIRFIDEAVDRAADEGKRLVHLCDARDAALPNQLVRDMLVDWLSDRAGPERDITLATYVIASDPLIRGVVASIKWATGRGDGIRVVTSLDQAVAGASEVLEQSGMIVPDILRIA